MLEWGVFIELADPPKATGLVPLRGGAATRERAVEAFKPYLNPSAWVAESLDRLSARTAPGVVYLFGHAWLADRSFTLAASATKLLAARELVAHMRDRYTGPLLLLVDTCHAAAMREALREIRPSSWTVIFASDEDESALSFSGAGSRFSLALVRAAQKLKKRTGIDALDLYHEARAQLTRSDVVAAQAVRYWVDGDALALSPRPTPNHSVLPRPHVWLRTLFVGLGSILAVGVIACASYYYDHVLIEVRIPTGVMAMTEIARITVHRADLDSGEETALREIAAPSSGVLRLRIPVGDSILRFVATFRDQGSRAMNLHVVTTPGWRLTKKQIWWALPDEMQVRSHPGIAYVPPTTWLRGVSREATSETGGFWIDLHPPKTHDYVSWLRAAIARGDIEPMESQLGAVRARTGAMAATGLDQSLGMLLNDLEPAFRQIDETVRRDAAREQPVSAQVTSLEQPCEECPAIVTRDEADLYCMSRGLRVPTRSEWELSVRGVDGRAYPWGNRFVKGRANVIRLPDKGEAYELAPVDAFKESRSPFGLWDTVGNAGDWVDSEGGYPRAFAGGNYRFNPEDVTVVSLLPDTGEVASVWPNTVRCVAAPQNESSPTQEKNTDGN